MLIYLVCFFLSFVVLLISQKFSKNKKLSFIIQVMSLVVLSILAGVRDISIGTDVETYVNPVFRICCKYRCSLLGMYGYNIEKGYIVLNYLVSLFTNKLYILMFVIQFFILFFSLLAIRKLYKENYPFVYLLFILLFYNMSLNIIRQFMAIGLCLYALSFLFENKNKSFFFLIFIASLFHSSSVLFIIVFILYKLLQKNPKNLRLIIMLPIILLVIYFSINLFFPNILNYIISHISILSKYKFYLTHYVHNSLKFYTIAIIIDVVFIMLYILFNKVYDRKSNLSRFYFTLLLIDIICLFVATKYDITYRFGLYFRIPALLFFIYNIGFIFINKERKNYNFFIKLISTIIVLLYWFGVYVFGNSGETIPYKITEEIRYENNLNINLLERKMGEKNDNYNID